MKTVSFYKGNRSDNLLHIETELCLINIKINLSDKNGNEVTSVEIIPDNYVGTTYYFDGCRNNRIIKEIK